MLKEFKEFAMRGNVIDMAVGVILGASFGKIVTSLVNDVIMPPLGLLVGRLDFSNLYLNLSGHHYSSLPEAKAAGAATINYGLFLNNVLDFFIVAFVIFMLIRQMNRLKRRQEGPATPQMRDCPYCMSRIHSRATRCPQCTAELKLPD